MEIVKHHTGRTETLKPQTFEILKFENIQYIKIPKLQTFKIFPSQSQTSHQKTQQHQTKLTPQTQNYQPQKLLKS